MSKNFSNLLMVATLVIACFFSYTVINKSPPEPEISTESILSEIKNLNELSTYQTSFSAVAEATNPKDMNEVVYYICYEAIIKLGIDFTKINISNGEEPNQLIITLPPVVVTEKIINDGTYKYLFIDKKYDNPSVLEKVETTCQYDLLLELDNMPDLYALAEENAKNIIRAIFLPFLTQGSTTYQLIFAESEVAS